MRLFSPPVRCGLVPLLVSNASRKYGYSSTNSGTTRLSLPSVFGEWTMNRLRSQLTSDHDKPVNSGGHRNLPQRAKATISRFNGVVQPSNNAFALSTVTKYCRALLTWFPPFTSSNGPSVISFRFRAALKICFAHLISFAIWVSAEYFLESVHLKIALISLILLKNVGYCQ